ncbi:hypothetical protein QZH41_014537, partial [Actinostola sp. cb2023]
ALSSSRIVGTVKATKTGATPATASFACLINDINDVIPAFPQKLYEVSISESTSIKSVLFTAAAIDEDSGINGQLQYTIVSGNEAGKFAINFYGGQISLSSWLDFEKETKYTLNITVQDQPGLSNWTMVVVYVLDADDLPAKFTAYSYSAAVSEDASLGAAIFQVQAFDLDKAINDTVTYVIDQGTNPSRLFAINSSMGMISLNGTLDRETMAEYTIRVLAYSSYPASDHATVTIHVTDVNDNKPVFTHSAYNGTVAENLSAGTIVLQVQATDKDKDVNDNAPAFLNSSYSITINESIAIGSEVIRVEAKDPDMDQDIVFSISTGSGLSRFAIDRDSGVISTKRLIDRDPPHNDTVFSLQVTITVDDVNDNTPQCSQERYSPDVYENATLTSHVDFITCYDVDSGDNARISYHVISGADGKFAINSTVGVIETVGLLDYEKRKSYNIKIQVSDHGNPQLSREVLVEINVININDNVPLFRQHNYSFSILEGDYSGYPVLVGLVDATDGDADISRSLFGQIRYSIVNTTGIFKINSDTGIISTSSVIDREGVAIYSLVVMAADLDPWQPLSNTTQVVIQVIDENDNSPVFGQVNYGVNVSEAETAGYDVIKVEASDSDIGQNANVTYAIISGNVGNVFTINKRTGQITISAALDRETMSRYELIIAATDGGKFPRKTTVRVNIEITDVNDHDPVCTQNDLTVKIKENLVPGEIVTQVSVSDKDLSQKTLYHLRSDSFAVNPNTGVINTTRPLDREHQAVYLLWIKAYNYNHTSKTANCSGILKLIASLDRETTSHYTIQIFATDRGLPQSRSSSMVLLINITDVNDNKPIFSNKIYNAEVSENVNNTSVLTLLAEDKDELLNGHVIYTIAGGNSGNAFTITTNGTIITNIPLDRELQDRYELTIMATDRGVPALSTSVTAIITVIDTNDNAPNITNTPTEITIPENAPIVFDINIEDVNDNNPVFNPVSYTANVTEGTSTGTFVIAVNATEKDEGVIGRITYKIESGDDCFSIDNSTVTVHVRDSNDLSPVFSLSEYYGTINENAAIGTAMIRVTAVDDDLGTNAQIMASDGKHNVYSRVIITVQDVNDNAPEFNKSEQRMNISLNEQKRAMLLHYAGPDVDEIFDTLPDTGEDDDFDTAVEKLNQYFSPKTNTTYEVYNFRQAKQKEGEMLYSFHTRLRQLSKYCAFPDTDKEIKEQIILSCSSNSLRRKTLRDDLNLVNLLKHGRALELSETQAKEVEPVAPSQTTSYNRYAPNKTEKCGNCGGDFPHRGPCKAKGKICNSCGKLNHFARVCRSNPTSRNTVRNVTQENVTQDDDEDELYAYTIGSNARNKKSPMCQLQVDGRKIQLMIDSGASVDLIDEVTFKEINKDNRKKLEKTNHRIYSYGTDTPLPVLGTVTAELKSNTNSVTATLHVVKGKTGNLLGFDTAQNLGLLRIINQASIDDPPVTKSSIYEEYKCLFEGVGKVRDNVVKLHIDPDVKPKQQPHRRIPFHVRKDVERELERLEKLDIIEEITGPTPWVSPIVVVPKSSGEVRICVDMREANKAVEREKHLMPTIDDLVADLNGATVFSKLDLSSGNISDDIIVYGKNQKEHDKNLRQVLERLMQHNVRLNKDKCSFSKNEIKFYGHIFSSEGIKPDPSKIDAINNMSQPTNVSGVRSLLGMTQYVSRFIPEHATITAPLRILTRQDVPWKWGKEQQQSFNKLKEALTADKVMAYFDPTRDTEVLVDASPVGLGALLVQDGKSISYASRALSDVECRYSQTEREMLAVVWSTEHFHLYLYGSKFKVLTNHKPLLGIFNSHKPTSARIDRWKLRLMPYDYQLIYRPGKDDNPADFMSRHPDTPDQVERSIAEEYVNYVCNNAVPKAMTLQEIKVQTKKDPELQTLITAIMTDSWTDANIQEFKKVRDELAVYSGMGIVKTKRLIREKVWFPGIDQMVKEKVDNCLPCQAATTQGPFPSGDYLLVVLDEYSRFPEVEIVTSTSARAVIPKLDAIFSRQGIPDVLKSDNGPPFNGHEFSNFAEYLGFHHRKITPVWPKANGEAERFMRSLKKCVTTAHMEHKNWKQELFKFLRQYQITLTNPLPRQHEKESDIKPGATVLVRQPRASKLSTPFDPKPLVVKETKGTMITASNEQRTVTRNSSHFKNTPGGTQVLQVKAYDRDEGTNAMLAYSLQGDDGKFSLDTNTGILFTTPQQLDRETKDFYNLTVTATDTGKNKATMTIAVHVLDVNDNIPKFNASTLTVTVKEDDVIFDVIATDIDKGINREIRYRIFNGNDEGMFHIDEITVIITIQDVNDNAPVFLQSSYQYTIMENSSMNYNVGVVSAKDKDTGTNGDIVYCILSTALDIPFTINTSSSVLSVNGSLDREKVSSYRLIVKYHIRTDITNPNPYQNHIRTDITNPNPYQNHIRTDITNPNPYQNNIRPDITNPNPYQYHIHPDITNPNPYQYHIRTDITNPNPYQNHIRTDITNPNPYQNNIRPDITNPNPYQNHIHPDITNPNPYQNNIRPDITNPNRYQYHIHPDITNPNPYHATCIRPDITNPNHYQNHIRTDITNPNPYQYHIRTDITNPNPYQNHIRTDITNPNPYQYHIRTDITNPNPYQNNIRTDITNPNPYQYHIRTDITNPNPYQYHIRPDITNPNPYQYHIRPDITNPNPYQYHIRPDITNPNPYQYHIRPDITNPNPYQNNIRPDITNPNPYQYHIRPDITNPNPYQYHIRPDITNPNPYQYHIRTDITNPNPYQYHIRPDITNPNPYQYHIRTDITNPNPYQNHIRTDITNPNHYQYHIHPDITNPNPYQYHIRTDITNPNPNPYQYYIRPDITNPNPHIRPDITNPNPYQYHICPDIKKSINVSYWLVNDYGVFSINSNTGQIVNFKSLDYEERTSYQLQVKAVDGGTKNSSSSCLVTVHVLDVNDNAPQFSKSCFYFQIDEDAIKGRLVGAVTARDRDSGSNARLKYILNNSNDIFTVNHNGGLSLVRSIVGLANQNITLSITCQDDGSPPLATNVTIYVSIKAGLRYTTKLIPRHLNISIYEDTITGYIITKLNASNQHNIEYIRLDENLGHFYVNSSTGQITVMASLDRERKASYQLFIAVKDRSERLNSDYGTVTITVLDVNDNAPRFIQKPNVLPIPENARNGYWVTQVTATDPDEGVNGKVFYSIEGQASNTFIITNGTGVITTITSLDFETNPFYNITVIAENTLSPIRMRSMLSFQIPIKDVLDFMPKFSRDVFKTRVSEDVVLGSAVFDVNATIDDQHSRYIVYRILHDQSSNDSYHFSIDPESGVLRTQASLDRETITNYTLVVEARDVREPMTYKAIAKVMVDVQDINDNIPYFTQKSYTFSAKESLSVGDVIGQIQADDKDEGENAGIVYHIIAGNEKGYCGIQHTSGEIFIAKSLDYESLSSIILTVRAYDKLRARRTRRQVSSTDYDEVNVTIAIQDVNDNAPSFTQTLYLGRFYPEEPDNTVVAVVQATDIDSADNIRYYAANESVPGVLLLNTQTGKLTRAQSLSNETVESYTMQVNAKDNNGVVPYNTATNQATIIVFQLTPSTSISLSIGIPLSLVTANRQLLISLLRNITGQTVVLKSLQKSPADPLSTMAVIHLIDNHSLTVVNSDQATRVFRGKPRELDERYRDWNIKVYSTGSPEVRKAYFSAYIGAMIALALLIGIAGFIAIFVVCRYKYREKHVDAPDNQDIAVDGIPGNAIDYPQIGAYIESRADHPRLKTRYKRQAYKPNTAASGEANEESKDGTSISPSDEQTITYVLSSRYDHQHETIDRVVNKSGKVNPSRKTRYDINDDNIETFDNYGYGDTAQNDPSTTQFESFQRTSVISKNPFTRFGSKGFSPRDQQISQATSPRSFRVFSPKSYSPRDPSNKTKPNPCMSYNIYDVHRGLQRESARRSRVRFDLDQDRRTDELEWERQVSNTMPDILNLASTSSYNDDAIPINRSKNESKTDDSPASSVSDGEECEIWNLEDDHGFIPCHEEHVNRYEVNPVVPSTTQGEDEILVTVL